MTPSSDAVPPLPQLPGQQDLFEFGEPQPGYIEVDGPDHDEPGYLERPRRPQPPGRPRGPARPRHSSTSAAADELAESLETEYELIPRDQRSTFIPRGTSGVPGTLHLVVYGRPAPQGSKRRGRNGQMLEMSKYVDPWRAAVVDAVAAVLAEQCPPSVARPLFPGVAAVSAVFSMKRPVQAGAAHTRDHPAGPPDVDKLIRSTLDALKLASVFHDDARVVDVRGRKVYCGGPDESLSLPRPGAIIVVEEA